MSVLFYSTPGTLTYVGPKQINVIAPYAIARKPLVSVIVTNNGIPSAPVNCAGGGGQSGSVHGGRLAQRRGRNFYEDNSLNSTSNPAVAGSIVTLFGTGEGLTVPAQSDGNITGNPLPVLSAPLSATVDGIAAPVLYQGEAPGLVSGVFQMNIRIPA